MFERTTNVLSSACFPSLDLSTYAKDGTYGRMTRIVLLALKKAAAPSNAVIFGFRSSALGYVNLCDISHLASRTTWHSNKSPNFAACSPCLVITKM